MAQQSFDDEDADLDFGVDVVVVDTGLLELTPAGIHVTALCPGFTHSEFHDAMGTREAALDPLAAARGRRPEGWAAVNDGKPICVPGLVNKVLAHVTRPIPFSAQYVLGRNFNPFA